MKSEQIYETDFAQKQITEKTDEELFLSSYDIEAYERPSVATDVAVFSMFASEVEGHRKDSEPQLSLLLIKRGEHPFMNKWALPGGFVKPDETIEQSAFREIKEETNLKLCSLMPVGVFSEPDRDPRGRIISNAFAAIISEENVKVMSGTDAIKAKWFEVNFEFKEDRTVGLELKSDEEVIVAELKEKETRFGVGDFEIITNDGLAFDHARIIATALSAMRNEAEKTIICFDYLPEKFTLAALQKVQETLMGISLLTANFRRKIADLVEETDEYTEGVGHRPARLFKRKDV